MPERRRHNPRPERTPEPADSPPPKDSAGRWLLFASVAFALAVAWTAYEAVSKPGQDLRHPAILDTAYFAFAFWAGAVVLMLRAAPGEWATRSGRVRLLRLAWPLSSAMFVIHVAVAFHFAHGWSHAAAYRHAQDVAGFGPGLFVSYFFAVVWAADATWLSVRPASYAARPRWLGWTVHAFLAFITFNGTVVYGHGLMRWVCAGVFAVLAWELGRSLRASRRISDSKRK